MKKFVFTIDDDTSLNKVRVATERKTNAEVVRDALSLYQMLYARVRAGEHIYLGKDAFSVAELNVTTFNIAEGLALLDKKNK